MTGPQRSLPGRRGSRVVLAAVGAGTLAVLTAGPAGAHVLIETVEPHGDGTSTLTFTFDHGCDGEPTDALRVTLPEGVEALAAGQPDGWSSDVGADAVAWSGAPVPDGERAAFTLDVRVTGDVGQAFVFPAVQECPSGASYAWTDTDPSGARPAPTFVATAASLAPAPVAAGAAPTPTAPLVAAVVLGAAVVGVVGGLSARRLARQT
ncbi:uncharacterized protein YcnI [Cellulosimicrobium cellulans]|jgi:uncharacterized protein YcnI|uniref:YncI copper-binding domain-containing protein n=1 Tax=Cellulosimicrobium cellulans TaxID=1710 RepID=A0A1Y0HWX0_CELCE|nr:DUF1775 domain-containing protein [Cellulosimicrobium cellulans]ARU51653.1 hypothetical protein CBR64_09355 [Cellulosimicrobium cellulans]MBM7818135.1 uncharacterized protein YcnI [Cellulosimicrobium cellulans]